MSDYSSSLPIRTENDGDVVSKIADATNPSQQLTVEADGSINVNASATDFDIRDLDASQDNVAISDGTDTLAINNDGSINAVVTATDLDIRDLSSATDSVEAVQATHDDLNVNANIQVGDVDVSNANPVPVSDAGGSITVDAVNLDIRDLVFATDKVDVSGSSVTVSATDLDIRNLSASQDNVAISDGTDTLAINNDGSINSVVSATNLDIRDLTHASDSVKIGDGTDFLAINADGSINVIPQEDPGTERVLYNTAAAIAGGASSNHDYAFTNQARLYQVWGSASGKLKIEVQVETGAATNVFNTIGVGFNSTADANIDFALSKYALVPAGARVRVIRTNRDNQAQDVYSTIVAIES